MVPKPSGFGKMPSWLETAKKKLFSKSRLIDELENYDKDNIPPDIIRKLTPMINNSKF